jgi:hypothetical protein
MIQSIDHAHFLKRWFKPVISVEKQAKDFMIIASRMVKTWHLRT